MNYSTSTNGKTFVTTKGVAGFLKDVVYKKTGGITRGESELYEAIAKSIDIYDSPLASCGNIDEDSAQILEQVAGWMQIAANDIRKWSNRNNV